MVPNTQRHEQGHPMRMGGTAVGGGCPCCGLKFTVMYFLDGVWFCGACLQSKEDDTISTTKHRRATMTDAEYVRDILTAAPAGMDRLAFRQFVQRDRDAGWKAEASEAERRYFNDPE